jgi:DNA (cytosine-5)-methyltransferase 1
MIDDTTNPIAFRDADVVEIPLCERFPASASTIITRSDVPEPLSVVGLFAGVGGLEEGFRQAGHASKMLCEVDPFARHVLKRHFPDAEITTDVTQLKRLPECDVIAAGFPCQDLSQVGRRKGISGPDSGLIESVFELVRRQRKRQRWLVLENVPFMLNLNRGHAIRTIVDALEEMGFSWAYRTIDTRAFGLPQRRRRVILLASQTDDPRPVLFGAESPIPPQQKRASHACGFYWTEGNTGLGWAVDAVPPLKGGSALHIPSPPAIWFPRRRLIAVPAIEDAERLQGFEAGWTRLDDIDAKAARKRWRMVGNAVSVPTAKWIAERLTAATGEFRPDQDHDLPPDKGWPGAAWGFQRQRGAAEVSEWPVALPSPHLSAFLRHRLTPLSRKATTGFHSRLMKSCLRYEEAFARDLARHIENAAAG